MHRVDLVQCLARTPRYAASASLPARWAARARCRGGRTWIVVPHARDGGGAADLVAPDPGRAAPPQARLNRGRSGSAPALTAILGAPAGRGSLAFRFRCGSRGSRARGRRWPAGVHHLQCRGARPPRGPRPAAPAASVVFVEHLPAAAVADGGDSAGSVVRRVHSLVRRLGNQRRHRPRSGRSPARLTRRRAGQRSRFPRSPALAACAAVVRMSHTSPPQVREFQIRSTTTSTTSRRSRTSRSSEPGWPTSPLSKSLAPRRSIGTTAAT